MLTNLLKSLYVKEIQFLLHGCNGNEDRYENFNFKFWSIFSSCSRVQSLIMIK